MSVPTIKITIAIECPPALPGELVGRLVRLESAMVIGIFIELAWLTGAVLNAK